MMNTLKELLHNALKYYIRNFPLAKGKERLLNALWKSLSSNRYQRQAKLRQAAIVMDCDLTQYIQRHIYFYGSYEEAYCEYWMSLTRQAQHVFDVGANVGIYSLLAAAANPNVTAHAFEPTPVLFDALTHNVRQNALNNVRLCRQAIADSEGVGFLHINQGSDGSNEGMNFVTGAELRNSDMRIKTTTLDNYCSTHGIKNIDLLKLDIEGGELKALLGASELLSRKGIGTILLELSEWAAERSGHSTADVKRLLSDAGYSLYQLRKGKLTPCLTEGMHRGDNNVIAQPSHSN